MNYRHVVLFFIVSIAFAACGAKQTPDRDAQTPQADLVLDGESFETIRVERTFGTRNTIRLAQTLYEPTPSYTFEVTEPTAVEIVAKSDQADLLLLIIGPAFPYQDDDTYSFHPAIQDTFEPGIYRVYVGVWGMPEQNVPYTLSFHHGHADDQDRNQAVYGDVDDYNAEDPVQGIHAPEPPAFPEGSADANAEPQHRIDAKTAKNQELSVTLKPAERVSNCGGVFDLERPLAVLENLNELNDDRLRIVLSQAKDAPALDTVMVGYLHGHQYICSDDFQAFYAGHEFAARDGNAGPISIYGGIWDEEGRLDENGEIKVALKIQRLNPEDWQIQTQNRTLSADVQHISIQGDVNSSIEERASLFSGYVRDITRPDIKLHVPKDGVSVQIDARLKERDSVLLIQKPDGSFVYNDDRHESLDSRLLLRDAPKGDYNIWIGQHFESKDIEVEGVISISQPTHYPDDHALVQSIDTIGKEGTTRIRGQRTADVTGDRAYCDGFARGYFDLSAPSVVLKNNTGVDGVLIVRTDGDIDTTLYGTGEANACGDDEILHNAAIALPLDAGAASEIYVGTANKKDAKQTINLRYILVAHDMLGGDALIEFIKP